MGYIPPPPPPAPPRRGARFVGYLKAGWDGGPKVIKKPPIEGCEYCGSSVMPLTNCRNCGAPHRPVKQASDFVRNEVGEIVAEVRPLGMDHLFGIRLKP
jgi:hypothetical protein